MSIDQPTWQHHLITGIDSISNLISPHLHKLLLFLVDNVAQITPATSLQNISVFQLAIHITSLALTAAPQFFLHQLATATSQKLRSEFFPSMPDNLEQFLAGIHGAMAITRLYRCACGEPYGSELVSFTS